MSVETQANAPHVDPNKAAEQEGVMQEIQKSLVRAQIPFCLAWGTGILLFAVGDRLSPSIRATLGGIFLANTVAFTGCLIRAGWKILNNYKALIEYHPTALAQALRTLEQPLGDGDREIARVVSDILQLPQTGRNSLGKGEPDNPFDLLAGSAGDLEQQHQGMDSTLALRRDGLLEQLPPEQRWIATDRLGAVDVALSELTDWERRRRMYSHIRREKVLEVIQRQIANGDLFKFPEMLMELKTAVAAGLKEGSPPVLVQIAETIRIFLERLITEDEACPMIEMRRQIVDMSLLAMAERAGVAIPGTMQGALHRQARRDKEPHIMESGRVNEKDIEALVWALAAIHLRSMPEVREVTAEIIRKLRASLSVSLSDGRLGGVKERLLEILAFGASVPHLGLKVSLHELAKKSGFGGASTDIVPAEAFGLDGHLGSICLVTLPQTGETQLTTIAEILTRVAIAFPLSRSYGIARSHLIHLNPFESRRADTPRLDELTMLFGARDVLDWLLAGRDPKKLLTMNLIRPKEPVETSHLLADSSLKSLEGDLPREVTIFQLGEGGFGEPDQQACLPSLSLPA